VPARALLDVIGAAGCEAAEAAERGFARVWARLPLAAGCTFRDMVTWREESLLWACESYLRRATAGPRCAGTAEACLRLLETLDPAEVDAGGLAPRDALLLSRAAVARGVLFDGDVGRVRPLPPGRAETSAGGAPRGLIARLGTGGAAARASVAGATLLAVHDGGKAAAVLEALLERASAEAGLAAAAVRG